MTPNAGHLPWAMTRDPHPYFHPKIFWLVGQKCQTTFGCQMNWSGQKWSEMLTQKCGYKDLPQIFIKMLAKTMASHKSVFQNVRSDGSLSLLSHRSISRITN